MAKLSEFGADSFDFGRPIQKNQGQNKESAPRYQMRCTIKELTGNEEKPRNATNRLPPPLKHVDTL